jgi:hypothetical protein
MAAATVATTAAYWSSTERLEVLLSMVDKTAEGEDGGGGWVAVNPRVMSEISGSDEKIDGPDYHVRERCVTKS